MKLIVTRTDGTLIERDRVRTHDTQKEAMKYGKEIYGYGNFSIKSYTQWKNTRTAKREIIKHQIHNRWNKFK